MRPRSRPRWSPTPWRRPDPAPGRQRPRRPRVAEPHPSPSRARVVPGDSAPRVGDVPGHGNRFRPRLEQPAGHPRRAHSLRSHRLVAAHASAAGTRVLDGRRVAGYGRRNAVRARRRISPGDGCPPAGARDPQARAPRHVRPRRFGTDSGWPGGNGRTYPAINEGVGAPARRPRARRGQLDTAGLP